MLDINTDLCKFFEKKNGANPFSNYFISLVRKYGKIPSCPILVVSFINFYPFFFQNEILLKTYFKGQYYVHNMTTKGMDIPSFSGFFLGKSDLTLKFRYSSKLKQKLISLLNVTFVGGYRNEK